MSPAASPPSRHTPGSALASASDPHAASRELAFSPRAPRRRADLIQDAAALGRALDAHRERARWLIASAGSYSALVALQALLRNGRHAVFAPNAQPETLRRLARECDGALVDEDTARVFDAAGLSIPVLAPLQERSTSDAGGRPPDREAQAIRFSTSGSSGEGKAIEKRVRHLDDEVAVLEQVFGPELTPETRFFATVSHQHIYGLLFRVLWPYATGRPFQRETLLHVAELVPQMRECSDGVLVTTPAHLKRMVAGEGLRPLAGRCRAVFSSGAPLPLESAEAVRDQLGFAPHEIYGSTETGGLAHRQCNAGEATWHAFPGVDLRIAASGCLEASSALISEGEELGEGRCRLEMADRAKQAADGGFQLLGRVDRTLKIAGKRLSLPAMEQELAAHEWVDEAALVGLEQGSEVRTHAVLRLSAAGALALAERGRRECTATLGQHLGQSFDRVTLPRAWRFVSELPRDAQGKLPVERLRAVFAEPVRDCLQLEEKREGAWLRRRLQVPEDLAALEGHFPGHPVVPGVAQLGWAMQAAEDLLGQPVGADAIEALKFPHVLEAGDRFWLEVELRPSGAAPESFRFRSFEAPSHSGEEERIFASGRCSLRKRVER